MRSAARRAALGEERVRGRVDARGGLEELLRSVGPLHRDARAHRAAAERLLALQLRLLERARRSGSSEQALAAKQHHASIKLEASRTAAEFVQQNLANASHADELDGLTAAAAATDTTTGNGNGTTVGNTRITISAAVGGVLLLVFSWRWRRYRVQCQWHPGCAHSTLSSQSSSQVPECSLLFFDVRVFFTI